MIYLIYAGVILWCEAENSISLSTSRSAYCLNCLPVLNLIMYSTLEYINLLSALSCEFHFAIVNLFGNHAMKQAEESKGEYFNRQRWQEIMSESQQSARYIKLSGIFSSCTCQSMEVKRLQQKNFVAYFLMSNLEWRWIKFESFDN